MCKYYIIFVSIFIALMQVQQILKLSIKKHRLYISLCLSLNVSKCVCFQELRVGGNEKE